jgi:hypothetical protein
LPKPILIKISTISHVLVVILRTGVNFAKSHCRVYYKECTNPYEIGYNFTAHLQFGKDSRIYRLARRDK